MIPEKLPTVPDSKEIIERSFKEIKKVQDIYLPSFLNKLKSLSIQKIKLMESVATKAIGRVYDGFPKIEDLDRFERDLLFIMVNGREYERSLNNLKWAKGKIIEFATNSIKGIKKAPSLTVIARFRSSFYGRFSSVIEDMDESLVFLKEAREVLKKVPQVSREMKIIIIAGFPNVGKSSLISKLTNLSPEIADYPFTTKNINVGMMKMGNGIYEVLDVPGLLNRKDHNAIERVALAAIDNIGNLVVCMLDPSEECGYSLEDQTKLCKSIKDTGKNVLIVENKSDLDRTDSDNLKISCFTGEGIEDLKKMMEANIRERQDKGHSVFQRTGA
ncbi:MAG: 50S ribosome-binding GTPase [Candidatus Thermoplasmatota archaeon]|nr:50S ribosome-binding GTPase [Candidatus Thermoplasmatota archaeon]